MDVSESERGKRKSWLKAQHSENKDHGIRSHHFMGNRWGNVETVADFILGGSKGGAEFKASACNVGDLGLFPALGRSPGEEGD